MYLQDKAENFVMAALFCASEEGNVDGLKELSEMANNIDLSTANKVSLLSVKVLQRLLHRKCSSFQRWCPYK